MRVDTGTGSETVKGFPSRVSAEQTAAPSASTQAILYTSVFSHGIGLSSGAR
jgi:hypothetical protein